MHAKKNQTPKHPNLKFYTKFIIYSIIIMTNNWIEFVKQFAIENNISYKEALKEAKKYYHFGGGLSSSRPMNRDDNFDSVVNNERKQKPNDKVTNRSIIDIASVPFSTQRMREIETEDQRKKSKKIYTNN